MAKILTEHQKIINKIKSNLFAAQSEHKDIFPQILQVTADCLEAAGVDTDIIIAAVEDFEDSDKNISIGIKVRYGY